MLRRIASNAIANVFNGVSAGVFQIGMTAVMARSQVASDLPLWSLAASFAGFAPLLACNAAIAVTRRLAGAGSDWTSSPRAAQIMAAARTIARYLLATGILIALILSVCVPALDHLPATSVWSVEIVVCALFVGSCWIVYSQPEIGWLITEQRNWPIAISGIAARICSLVVTAVLVLAVHAAMAPAILFGSASLWLGSLYLSRVVPDIARIPWTAETSAEFAEIGKIVGGFAIWSLAAASIQTATIPVISVISPALVTSYYLSFTIAIVFAGAVTAIANALVAPLAHALGNHDMARVEKIGSAAIIVLSGGLIIAFVALYAELKPAISFWVGAHHAKIDIASARTAFLLIGLQQILRSTGVVPAIILGLGSRPRILLYSPLVEAAGFLLIALPLAIWSGPIAYVLGLSLAGCLGSWVVVGLTISQMFRRSDKSISGARLILACALVQAAAIGIVWILAR